MPARAQTCLPAHFNPCGILIGHSLDHACTHALWSTEALDFERGLVMSFDRMVRNQLDPVWNKLGKKQKQLVLWCTPPHIPLPLLHVLMCIVIVRWTGRRSAGAPHTHTDSHPAGRCVLLPLPPHPQGNVCVCMCSLSHRTDLIGGWQATDTVYNSHSYWFFVDATDDLYTAAKTRVFTQLPEKARSSACVYSIERLIDRLID